MKVVIELDYIITLCSKHLWDLFEILVLVGLCTNKEQVTKKKVPTVIEALNI